MSMKKKPIRILLAFIGFLIFISILMFWHGNIESKRYYDPYLDGEKLPSILGRIPAHEASIHNSSGDFKILFDHRNNIRNCILKWLKERDKATEVFYLLIMETIEGKRLTLVEHRGAVWFHARALKAIDILNINDDEIHKALIELHAHYENSNYFIRRDINILLDKQNAKN